MVLFQSWSSVQFWLFCPQDPVRLRELIALPRESHLRAGPKNWVVYVEFGDGAVTGRTAMEAAVAAKRRKRPGFGEPGLETPISSAHTFGNLSDVAVFGMGTRRFAVLGTCFVY